MWTLPRVHKMRLEVAKRTGIRPSNVVPLMNYHEEFEKNPEIEQYVRRVLMTAIQCAEDGFRYHYCKRHPDLGFLPVPVLRARTENFSHNVSSTTTTNTLPDLD